MAEQQVRQSIEDAICDSGAETVGVAYHDTATEREVLLQPDAPFHPASTIKLSVMMELYHQAHQHKFSLDDRIPIKNEFRSIVDGSPFTLSAEDDSETTLYGRLGETETLRALIRPMITRSSNLATNILIERVGPEHVTAFMHSLGANGLLLRRGVEDNKAFALGLNNVGTARGLMQILVRLAAHRVVSPQASEEMIAVLKAQTYHEGLPADLPPGTEAAHKTGWNDKLYHDAGIIYPVGREAYVLVVMTRGIADETAAHRLVARISRLLYDYSTAFS